MSRDILNQTGWIRAPFTCPYVSPDRYPHVDLECELWPQGGLTGCSNGNCRLSFCILVLCLQNRAASSRERRITALGTWETSAGLYGTFKYRQRTGFSASHITHGKLSGNLSSEQNTVLNEALSSIIGHPGETFK